MTVSTGSATGVATSPDPIVEIATGFMAAKQLFAANRIGLFGGLAAGPKTAGELASDLGFPERSVRIVADAMVGTGLLDHDDERYELGEAARAYLAGDPSAQVDLRPFLTFWEQISYPHWLGYGESVATATPAPLTRDEAVNNVFLAGGGAFNALHALMLVDHYDFTAHSRVLDLGGLSGHYLNFAAARHPGLQGTFFSSQALVDIARGCIDPAVADRITFQVGDILTDPIPDGHDLILFEHVAHRYDAAQNRRLLARTREAVPTGTRLLMHDFFLEPDGERGLDAMLAGEYLVIDGTVVYPEDEVREWLADSGWKVEETILLPGSPRVLVADAV